MAHPVELEEVSIGRLGATQRIRGTICGSGFGGVPFLRDGSEPVVGQPSRAVPGLAFHKPPVLPQRVEPSQRQDKHRDENEPGLPGVAFKFRLVPPEQVHWDAGF